MASRPLLCWKPQYSVRRQLLVSFGTTAFLSIGVVVLVATLTIKSASQTVQQKSHDKLQDQILRNVRVSSRYVADSISKTLENFEGAASIIAEFTADRVVGYPDQGYEDDRHVPFFDDVTKTNKYPLKSPPLPQDWNFVSNINETNAKEHLQNRVSWKFLKLSYEFVGTHSATYSFQGNCDPSQTSPWSPSYYPNCTEENNNVETGGVVAPTATNKYLAEKAADLGLLLKPLWESHHHALIMGIYFHNSGAGSSVVFPSKLIVGTGTYISDGCDWMREKNPFTGIPFGTEEEIQRCHPQGTVVSDRDYNPMERAWCQNQALNPGKGISVGPFLSTPGDFWLMSFGRAVFDRLTHNFIGCTLVAVEIAELVDILLAGDLFCDHTESALIRTDGTVVASTLWDHSNATETVHVTELPIVDEHLFEELLTDFSQPWDPSTIRSQLGEKLTIASTGGLGPRILSSYPVPVPPSEYDPDYRPEYWIILSVADEVFDVIDTYDETIKKDLYDLNVGVVAIGAGGMGAVLLIIWVVARFLTRPLNWMERVAWRIVNHSNRIDGQSSKGLQVANAEGVPSMHCTPKTEITGLVTEFGNMIQGFSGKGMASKVAHSNLHEISNALTWRSEFQQIYSVSLDTTAPARRLSISRVGSNKDLLAALADLGPEDDFESESITSDSDTEQPKGLSVVPVGASTRPATENRKSPSDRSLSTNIFPAPPRVNLGCNALGLGARQGIGMQLRDDLDFQRIRVHRSPLFWWIVILIVIPLLATNVAISVIVTRKILEILPTWMGIAEETSFDVELDVLASTASLRSTYAHAVLEEPLRDLHLLTRMAGWLLFGGVTRSEAFTSVTLKPEECKYHEPGACPVLFDTILSPCDCEWNDPQETQCHDYATDTRVLQRRFVCAQAGGYDAGTGKRVNIDPNSDRQANETRWWNDTSTIGGHEKGSGAAGYHTAYDRIRVDSALAVVDFPIYRYSDQNSGLGTYIGYEADGSITGYDGCGITDTMVAHFESTEDNKAFAIGGDLCPLGKFGYDVRCRSWYASGKNNTLQKEPPIHITPPYLFADGLHVATSATSSLFDPETGQHVGQTLIDFLPQKLFAALSDTDVDFAVVITPENDIHGGDTVVGPGLPAGSAGASIVDVMFPQDAPDSLNRRVFERDILPKMKAGESGVGTFARTSEDGSQERLILAYEPVYFDALTPVRPDDYSRGALFSYEMVYSLGVVTQENKLSQPFEEIESEANGDLGRLGVVYLCMVSFISLVVMLWTGRVSVVITKPMILLLRVVENINARRIEDDIPPLQGGSREVNQVYNSFAKLYRIMRVSNGAFFSGNLKWAFHFVRDSLQLFRKIDDKKAIGIACNNLGNTLLAMWTERVKFDERDSSPLVALYHLDEAVVIATRELDAAATDDKKAEYVQQLANRHFNRAMLLLLTQSDKSSPDDARNRGLQDLLRARQLDYDVRDYWMDRKLLLKNSCAWFELLIRRIHGLVELYADETVQNLWDAKELVEEADRLLFAAWNEPTAPLFESMTPVGRLQQLEDVVVRLELRLGNTVEAARVGMRMLVEDEFIIESAFQSSASALIKFLKSNKDAPWSARTASSLKSDIRTMLKSCKNVSVDIGKSLVICLEISEKSKNDSLLSEVSSNCLHLYDEYCNDDDYMGLLCFSDIVDGDLSMELQQKRDHYDKQRKMLEKVAKLTSGRKAYAAFPFAVQLVVDAAESIEIDSFIVLVMDGGSWNADSFSSVKQQIDRVNRERNTTIHAIIIGLNLPSSIAEQCKSISTVSRSSLYLDASADNLDSVFDYAAYVISGRNAISGNMHAGITMEKF